MRQVEGVNECKKNSWNNHIKVNRSGCVEHPTFNPLEKTPSAHRQRAINAAFSPENRVTALGTAKPR